MDLGLRGRKALVFGSSSGLGRAVAESLIAEGARVIVTSRDVARARLVASDLGAEAGLGCDLAIDGSGRATVEEAAALLGGLDICVVNTGGGKPGPILATDGHDDAGYRAMLRPVLEISRAAAPHVVRDGSGRLVYLTARSVVEASPDLALSSVFRSGVRAAARSLAIELAPAATVNVVVTGQFDTPALARSETARAERVGRSVTEIRSEHVDSIPMGRVGLAAELGDVVAFLCSARASFVTGTDIRVDGGAVRGF